MLDWFFSLLEMLRGVDDVSRLLLAYVFFLAMNMYLASLLILHGDFRIVRWFVTVYAVLFLCVAVVGFV